MTPILHYHTDYDTDFPEYDTQNKFYNVGLKNKSAESKLE